MKKLKERTKKLLIGLSAVFILYSLAGFFLVPYLIKTVAADKLTELLRRETSVEKVRFNPYSFDLKLFGFRVMEGAEVFASFEGLSINLQGRSLVKGGLTVKALTLENPYIKVVHKKDLSYNFSDLIPKGGPAKTEPSKKSPLKFSFNNIRVLGGSVDFIDEPKGKAHEVRDMNVEIPFISSIPSEVEVFVKPSFSARVNGTVFDLKGESKPFADSFETSLDIKLDGLSLPQYLAYSPVPLKFRMPSGELSALLALSYIQYRDRGPELTVKGGLNFRGVELQDDKGARMASLPSVDLAIGSVDFFDRKAIISSVVLGKPDISLVRQADGAINLRALAPGRSNEQTTNEDKGTAFILEIDSVEVSKARLSFSDYTRRTPVRMSFNPVDMAIKGLSTSPGRKAETSLAYKGSSGEGIRATGSLSISPVEVEIELKADAVDLRPLEPYLEDVLNIAVASGRVSATGTVSAGLGDGGAGLSYRGSAVLSRFSAADRASGADLVKWASLSLDGIEFDLAPRRVVVRSAVLSDFHSNLFVGRDGRLNASGIIPAKKAQNASAQTDKPGAQVASSPAYMRIDSIAFRGGKVDFRDFHVEPAFLTSVDELKGSLKGLYLDGSRLAEMNLSGRIDKYAPFEAAGKVNPDKKGLFVDMRLRLDGFELSSLTPYSGKYIGYVIDKGKIFLDLGYFIEKRALKADNKVLIDQITLGERVESLQATGLPVSFAISLLKDRSGQIRLDVPLSGSLDDPEFSVGALIIQVLFNLVEKAVTSPFALIGSLFGSGEDLGFVEFEPGSDSLTEASARKLDALVAALYERPGLKLDVEGFVSVGEDGESLSERKFMMSLEEEKARDMPPGRSGKAALDKGEFEKFLFLAYKRADFKKETNFLGMVKRLPAPDLERLLREHLRATEDDLSALAARRSNAVRDYILGSGKVEPSRVFIRWPKDLMPEKNKERKDSRVEFKLQ